MVEKNERKQTITMWVLTILIVVLIGIVGAQIYRALLARRYGSELTYSTQQSQVQQYKR